MKIFKSQLQRKLIFSFIIVGVSPMIVSLLIATKIISRQLEDDIKRRLYSASTTVDTSIQSLQNKAFMAAKLLLNRPEFIVAFKNRDYKTLENMIRLVEAEIPVDIILPQEVKAEELERTLMHVETQRLKSLLAGVIVPINNKSGENIGRLIAGDLLADRFAQAMSQTTEVEVRILRKVSPDAEAVPVEKLVRDIQVPEGAIREVFEKAHLYYDNRDTRVKGRPYAALYKPLLSVDGNMLGFIFLGIPKTYAFQIVMRRFLPILLCTSTLLAAAIGYVIARSISTPINRFIKGAKEIAFGNLNQYIELDSKDEIGKLASAFNTMAEELKKMHQMEAELRKLDRLSALGQLAAGVAHEVRNPLGIIKNSAQILRGSSLGEARRKEILNFIVEESDRINKVIDNFLQFARSPKMKKEKIEINSVIDRTVRLVGDTLAKNKIEVEKDYTDLIFSVHADPSQLQQLFLNLILNAIEAMPHGGKLEISTRLEDHGVRIIFADTGGGIPKGLKKKIFEPFYTTRKHGTGLGLAIAHKIVENHGGRIEVESEVEKGSTFNIWLPVE